jgi:hypothetical protein
MARHPHFDDRGTLEWHTRLQDALEQARREGKKVLIEFGREICGQCRAMVEGVVPHPQIAPLLQRGFVGLAADCDEPEPEVEALAARVEGAMLLPFVIFTDAAGNFLDGSSGPVHPATFKRRLEELSG